MATIEPTATADAMYPTVLAPPPKASTATAGNNARGMARTMAQKSARNVIRTLGRVPKNRNPSRTLASPGRPRPSASGCGCGGIGGNRNKPHMAAVNRTTSTPYARV